MTWSSATARRRRDGKGGTGKNIVILIKTSRSRQKEMRLSCNFAPRPGERLLLEIARGGTMEKIMETNVHAEREQRAATLPPLSVHKRKGNRVQITGYEMEMSY